MKTLKIAALITAAGSSQRFGQNKILYKIKNKPIIYYTLQRFNKSQLIDFIILVVHKDKLDFFNSFVKDYKLDKVKKIVAGGNSRFCSIFNGLFSIEKKIIDYIFIHDGARPYFRDSLLKEMISLTKQKGYDAIIPVVKVADTVKYVKDGKIFKTLDRKELVYVQTPQFFNYSKLRDYYEEIDNQFTDKSFVLDDSFIFEYFNHSVFVVDGDRHNIKLTYKEDVKFLSCIL